MDVSSILLQLINGLTMGFILLLFAMGISLIFGLMGIVNFAHGAFYALGAYLTYTFIMIFNNFWIALILAPIIVGIIGMGAEVVFFRRLYRIQLFYQLVLTFGLSLIIIEIIRVIWGIVWKTVSMPPGLVGQINIGIANFPIYRIFVLVLTSILTIILWLFLTKTNVGLYIQAGIENKDMAKVLGVDISRIYTLVFSLGVALAGLSAAIATPIVGVYPEMGLEIIIRAFVVVVIGGIGSFKGTVVASLLVGVTIGISILFIPAWADMVVYIFMALFLLLRPTGLYGKLYF